MAIRVRAAALWVALLLALTLPIWAAAHSPLLQWRQPVYVAAGFAGMAAMGLLLLQPLLAGGHLPGLPPALSRRLHRWVGLTLVLAVLLHVAGLWITSPPDAVDVLLFRSPTPFSVWGAVAMWALFGAALLATLRSRLAVRVWRAGHTALVCIAVLGGIVHALLIEGTMEPVSKAALCLLAALALFRTVAARRVWAGWRGREPSQLRCAPDVRLPRISPDK